MPDLFPGPAFSETAIENIAFPFTGQSNSRLWRSRRHLVIASLGEGAAQIPLDGLVGGISPHSLYRNNIEGASAASNQSVQAQGGLSYPAIE